MHSGALAALFLGVLATGVGAAQVQSGRPFRAILSEKAATDLLTFQERPDYPPVAKVNYIHGHVHIRIVVTAEGRVGEAHVVEGEALLAAACLDAVRKWRYRPYRNESGPAEFQTIVRFNFNLQIPKPETMPPHPQEDFARAVKPPELETKFPASGNRVRLRVLVGRNGQVLDSIAVADQEGGIDAARQVIRKWKFRPARWGALAVPWYVVVDVPVEDDLAQPGTGHPSGI